MSVCVCVCVYVSVCELSRDERCVKKMLKVVAGTLKMINSKKVTPSQYNFQTACCLPRLPTYSNLYKNKGCAFVKFK